MNSLELFTGAGGLAMGLSLVGLESEAVIEWDKNACNTLRVNIQNEHALVRDWKVTEGDVRDFDFSQFQGRIDLLAGGPPCQPFSLGGKSRAYNDERNMLPAMINAIRQVKPRAFIVENVKGLTRRSFLNYFQYTLLQLEYPDILIGNSETWIDHFARLEKLKTSGYASDETYDIVYRVVNAADYGVPQCRERVFIVGFRHDQQIEWSFPKPTNSYEALLYSQYISGEYCQRHNIARNDLPTLSDNIRKKLEILESETPVLKPWKTVRDALLGLPPPTKKGDCKFANHNFQPGAKVYPGHTGSCIDLPAKTIKAGAHGVPGGENMLILPSGKPRYFTIRESARLQTFPDDYVFTGSSWGESMRQIGNAVPVRLAKAISSSVVIQLLATQAEALRTPKLIFRS